MLKRFLYFFILTAAVFFIMWPPIGFIFLAIHYSVWFLVLALIWALLAFPFALSYGMELITRYGLDF